MIMNTRKIEDAARKMAQNAKNGTLKLNGNLYTFEFCQKHWVYNVYENDVHLLNFNTKSIVKARKMLREWLNN